MTVSEFLQAQPGKRHWPMCGPPIEAGPAEAAAWHRAYVEELEHRDFSRVILTPAPGGGTITYSQERQCPA